MKYGKPPLTVEQQVELLLSRGMIGDRTLIASQLASVSYYRLSGYWLPFRSTDDSFKPGTTFENVWQRYVFDRQLRLLAIDAIERIEVLVRTQLALHHSLNHGPFAYIANPASLPNLDSNRYNEFINHIENETSRSHETFVKHFQTKYGDCHEHLPIWMAAEIMSFGCMLTFFRGSHPDIRKSIAVLFDVHDVVLESWLLTLNTIRNFCAHHSRLWNPVLGIKPKIPDKAEKWHKPVPITNDRIFSVFTICKYCLDRIAPQSRWSERVHTLLSKMPGIPLESMGFPGNWEQSPIWK
ncbi:MAG TPA: Abi family protein [Thermoguttaceae bacterium]